ncbi:rhomboid family intramembrane serine protease [Bdellovibrio bacteriovorus]|uniref:rhomboid family intramembrane serine protease n=1 Tax=Bdellovibrio TaxID=958 RepID=UPI0035A82545
MNFRKTPGPLRTWGFSFSAVLANARLFAFNKYMLCPNCLNTLKLLKPPQSVVGCTRCGGRWHSFKSFQSRVGGDKAYQELLHVAHQAQNIGKTCPSCRKKMKPLRTPQNETPLDICFPCQHVWFDFTEFEKFKGQGEGLGTTFATFVNTQKMNLNGLHLEAFQMRNLDALVDPRFYESPVQNKYVIKKFPFFTYLFIGICFLVFLKFRQNIPELWNLYAFRVGDVPLENLKKLFTSFFVHSGWGHLLGNIYFFGLIAGEAEDVSPTFDFLAVVIGGHIVGTILEALALGSGTMIGGASAGVFSMMVYYSILFPKARFQGIMPIGRRRLLHYSTFVKYSLPIQAYVVIKIFLEFALWGMGPQGIAHLAHLGGAFVGLVVGITRRNKV